MEITLPTILSHVPIHQYDWDPLDPDTTSSWNLSMDVKDRHGIIRHITVYFRREDWKPHRSGSIVFSAHVMIDGSAVDYGVKGVPFEAEHYRLDFQPLWGIYSAGKYSKTLCANRTGGARNRWHWRESDRGASATDRINVDFEGSSMRLDGFRFDTSQCHWI